MNNPYASPVPVPDEDIAVHDQEPAKRPLGILLLSVLFALGGLLFVWVLGVLVADYKETLAGANKTGIPTSVFVAIMLATGLALVAIPFGLWKGAKWAWWLVAFWFHSGVVGALVFYLPLVVFRLMSNGDVEPQQAGKALRGIAINGPLLFYLLRPNVLRFFHLTGLSKFKAILILTAVVIVFVLLLSIPIGIVVYRMKSAERAARQVSHFGLRTSLSTAAVACDLLST